MAKSQTEVKEVAKPSREMSTDQKRQVALAERLIEFMAAEEAVTTKHKDVKVVRDGKQIILPESMSYKEAILWIRRQEEAEEKNVAIHATIDCFPLDGIIAFKRALEEIYGYAAYADTPGFFGTKNPPVMIQVELYDGSIETAPYGRIQPPMYEGGFMNCGFDTMKLIISGEVKQKFEKEVKLVIDKTKELLASRSIYRGTSFIINLDWMEKVENGSGSFHPVNHAPKFMDVSDVNENGLILRRDTLMELESNIFLLIENSDDCRKNNIPLKHGCLFVGKFGTGKTLSARVIASKAVRNKWTFIYLKTPDRIAHALKMAEMYAPAVVFTEDIDDVVNGERDAGLNMILNTLDGVDTKDKPIITILTTNNAESINPAMVRPGRIDTIIRFAEPDAEAAFRFVLMYAKDDDEKKLIGEFTDDEKKQVGEALAGFVPAFIAEAVQKAKRFAIRRHGSDITGMVTAQDLLDAATGLKSHQAMVEAKQPVSEESLAAAGFSKAVEFAMKPLKEDVQYIKDNF